MRSLSLEASITRPAQSVFDSVADFESYAQLCPAVREVVIVSEAPGVKFTAWEVNFRNGILRWLERDEVSRADLTIAFSQTEGDVEELFGRWAVTEADDGPTVLSLSMSVDLGMPMLADFLEPVAVQALRENLVAIITGLFGDDVVGIREGASASPPAVRA
ncbi:MAG: SRPBCC family protein [Actinobacteria bacterium]|nr:SRPBCC family protein [Actinomycetota bacterium]MCA1720156.1 SRPBCC family protein [Actinomycetota bacterium]